MKRKINQKFKQNKKHLLLQKASYTNVYNFLTGDRMKYLISFL